MEGVLLVHAASGHALFSKAYAEGFGVKREAQPGDSSAPKDPLILSMLMANFLCALYTNVVNLIDTTDAPADSNATEGLAAAAAQSREEQLDSMMRDTLSSFDTGSGGPLLFFKRDASCPSVFLVLFLRRELLDGSAGGSHAPDAECHECMRSLGSELAERLLHSFLATYGAELRTGGSKAAAATKQYRPWLKTLESLYASSDFARAMLDRVVERIATQFAPRWIYVLHAHKLMPNMEAAWAEKHAIAAAAGAARKAQIAPAAASATAHKRRGSNGVADTSSIVAQPPAFVPHPPAHPSPAAMAAASAGASPSAGPPVAPAPSSNGGRFYPSTRPLSVRPGQRFPFQPAPPRRWWHFGRGSAEQPETFWRDVGRTTCFYAIAPSEPTREAVADERGPKVTGDEESKQQSSPQAFASSFAPLPSPLPSPSPSPPAVSGGAAAADPSLPSPVALHKLVSLLYHAGSVLSAPSEVGDALASMELTLALPPEVAPSSSSASSRPLILPGRPAPFVERARVKLMVMRVAEMMIALPTAIVPQQTQQQTAAVSAEGQQQSSSAAASLLFPPPPQHRSLSMPALLSAVGPLLRCVETHFACVSAMHERADKAMRKEMDKIKGGAKK